MSENKPAAGAPAPGAPAPGAAAPGATAAGGSKPGAPAKPPAPGSKPESGPPTDLIQGITGAFGKYQIWICFLMFLSKMPVAFHQMAIIFLIPKIQYTCKSTNKKNDCPCDDPEYDRSIFTNTLGMEHDLICGRKYLGSLVQMMFQCGTLLGSVFFGMASDRWGRKHPLSVAVILQVSSSFIAIAMDKYYWIYIFFRFLAGLSVGGTMVITFVVVMEFVGSQYRDLLAAFYQMPFNLGHVLLPVIAYFTRSHILFQIVISSACILQLSYICLAPNTPRWLIAVNRTDEAIKILETVAKINNRPTDRIRSDCETYQRQVKGQLKKGTVADLFKTPNIRKNILAMSYNWFTCSYCFYGVGQYVGQLSGDVFLNVFCTAVIALMGTVATIPLMRYLGRRTIIIIFNFTNAICLFVLAMLPEDGNGRVACACIGVVSSFVVFVLVYLHCTELFPTVVRSAALGFSSMCARIGSIIAPVIVELKDNAQWLPPVLFGIVPLIGGFTTFLLPETKGCNLTSTIEEGEAFGKKVKK